MKLFSFSGAGGVVLAILSGACATHDDPHSEAAHGRKVMALLEKFDRFDYNADGHLTRAEIEQGVDESDVPGVNATEIDHAMEFYDVTGDGRISRWEANRAVDQPLPEH